MFKYFVLVLVVVLLALYFLGTPMTSLRLLGYIFVAFGIIIFLLGGLLEEGVDFWAGSAWMIKVAAVFFVIGLVLIFIQF